MCIPNHYYIVWSTNSSELKSGIAKIGTINRYLNTVQLHTRRQDWLTKVRQWLAGLRTFLLEKRLSSWGYMACYLKNPTPDWNQPNHWFQQFNFVIITTLMVRCDLNLESILWYHWWLSVYSQYCQNAHVIFMIFLVYLYSAMDSWSVMKSDEYLAVRWNHHIPPP